MTVSESESTATTTAAAAHTLVERNGSAAPHRTDDDDEEESEFEHELQAAGLVEPPDGGYGWLIVAASFMANCIVDGVIFTAGPGFASQWEAYFEATTGATSLAVSLLSGCYLLAGPIVSALANSFGCRAVAMAGTALTTVGFLASLFAPNLYVLYVTFGIMGGLGFGMVFLPSIVIVSYYFKTKRALATGIAVCGSGIGMFVFAPLLTYLQTQYTWQQTLLITAGIVLQLFVCAALYRPLEPTERQVAKVAELAMEHEAARVMSVRSLHQQASYEAEHPVDTTNNNNLPILSETKEHAEEVRSPHVQQGVRIERFEDPESSEVRHRGKRRNSTPFKSALELSARSHSTLHQQPAAPVSTADLLHAASKDTVHVLNRPLSRMDIFYTGSTTSLALRPQPGSSRAQLPAISMLSLATLDEAGGRASGDTWKDLIKSGLRTMVDVSLFKSPVFLVLALNGFLTMACFFVPFSFLGRAAQAKGHDKESSAFLTSIIGIVNIFARVFCGWLSDRPQLDALTIHNVALCIAGLATMAIPFCTAYWMFVVYCLLFGFGTACFASLRSVICVELLGLERLSNSFGLCMLFMGVAALLGAPLAGFLADATGSYDVSFYVLGFVLFLSGVIAWPLRRIARWEQRRMNPDGDEDPDDDPNNMDPTTTDAEELQLTELPPSDSHAALRTKLALISNQDGEES